MQFFMAMTTFLWTQTASLAIGNDFWMKIGMRLLGQGAPAKPQPAPAKPADQPAKPAPAEPDEDIKTYDQADALAALGQVQNYYNQVKSFQAKFKQVFTKKFHGDQPEETGIVYIKKPGYMLWDYLAPSKKMFLIDGKKAWMYEPESKQALWRDVKDSSLPTPVKFLWGQGKLTDEFHVKLIPNSKFAGKNQRVLKLLPRRRSPHYKSVLFVIDSRGAVAASLVYDHEGNRNRIDFSAIETNKPMDDKKFMFTPPKGVQVLQAGDDTPAASGK